MSQNLIVMGPEGHDSPSNLLIAPKFNHTTDKYQYRRDVREWYDYVISSSECGCSKALSVAANLGRSLRARLDNRHKGIVDSALRIGKIRFKNKVGSSRLSTEEQVNSVEAILSLIAKDSMNDRVQRVVRMSQDVYACKRENNESFQEFATRFQYAANAFLSYTQAGANHINELNFAMICLENARMDVSTYNHVVDTLVSKAQTEDYKPPVLIEHEDVDDIATTLKSLIDTAQRLKDTDDPSDELKHSVNKALSKAIDCSKGLKYRTECTNHEESEKINVHITLDKTLTALRNMKSRLDTTKTPRSSTPTATGGDTNSDPASETLRKIGAMMANSVKEQEKSQNRYHGKKRKFGRQQRKGEQGSNSDRQNSHHSDGESQDYEHCSQDDYRILKKAKHIIERMDRSSDGNKKVRFNESSEGKRHDSTRAKHDNKGDPFFQKPVPQSPRRT